MRRKTAGSCGVRGHKYREGRRAAWSFGRKNIGFRYGAKGREIWRTYSISIKSGERLGLYGPQRLWKDDAFKAAGGVREAG